LMANAPMTPAMMRVFFMVYKTPRQSVENHLTGLNADTSGCLKDSERVYSP
jgi:hypothetical protein